MNPIVPFQMFKLLYSCSKSALVRDRLPFHIYNMPKRFWIFIKPLLLPLLVAAYPSLFYYGGNVAITVLPNLLRALLINILVAVIVYILFFLVFRRNGCRGAVAAAVFLIFFNTYGILFDSLISQDFFMMAHYTFLPLFILLSLYTAWFVVKFKASTLTRIWNYSVIILTGLVVFNVVQILPVEIDKARDNAKVQGVSDETNAAGSENYPDIYYIVLDEFAGFEPMRKYWKYHEVDEFKQFLEDRGFFVAEQSHGVSETTIYELAIRLNYEEYSCCSDTRNYFSAIVDNRVMRFLKAKGYTTMAFDQSGTAFPKDLLVKADYFYAMAPDTYDSPALLDEFVMLVLDRTMVRAFSYIYVPIFDEPRIKMITNMFSFTQEEISNLKDIRSPKLVYVHLLLPHMPFLFDESGNMIATYYNTKWEDYLGHYIYSISYAEEMVTNILAQADPNNPPVIILQSDHGARNQIFNGNEDHLLENYPEEFKTWILYTLHIPGMDMSNLPQDINPINTFPIVFNYLFDADIPLK